MTLMQANQGEAGALYHLIYASKATERLSQGELANLLKAACTANQACGITGMLLYRDGTYLQYVEGKPEDLNRLLDRLLDDPRHKDIRVVEEGNRSSRLFPEWSMAFKNLTGLRSQTLAGYSELLQGHNNNNTKDRTPPEHMLLKILQDILQTA